MIEFFTSAILVIALIFVVVAWFVGLGAIVWPEIKVVYSYYKEKFNEPADPR